MLGYSPPNFSHGRTKQCLYRHYCFPCAKHISPLPLCESPLGQLNCQSVQVGNLCNPICFLMLSVKKCKDTEYCLQRVQYYTSRRNINMDTTNAVPTTYCFIHAHKNSRYYPWLLWQGERGSSRLSNPPESRARQNKLHALNR